MSDFKRAIAPSCLFLGLSLGIIAAIAPSIAQSQRSQSQTPRQPARSSVETVKAFDLLVPNAPFAFLASQLPEARGTVTWQRMSSSQQNTSDRLVIQISGLPAEQEYTIFLTEKATPTFGGVTYLTDLKTDENGNGTAVYQGEVKDAFIFEWGGPMNPAVYERTNLDHVVIWPADFAVSDRLFEKQKDERRPRTPFDADGKAGVVVLTTANDPNAPGPLQ